MTEDALNQLAAETSTLDYAAMVRLARAAYGLGYRPEAVIELCYGVAFPREFFVIAEAKRRGEEPYGTYPRLPWQLTIPLAEGGPPLEPTESDLEEQKAFARDPNLVPVFRTGLRNYVHGSSILCYHLDELRNGRFTIIGFPYPDFAEPPTVEARYGDSLVAVLIKHFTHHFKGVEAEFESPHNRGAGSITEDEMERAELFLDEMLEIARSLG